MNAHMNDRALAALDLQENDSVLEIGFGGGSLIDRILAKEQATHVTGADISALAVKSAKKRFQKAPRAIFKHIDGDLLPFKDTIFTQVVGVNVIYFWPDVSIMLSEAFRVLANESKLVLCYSEQSPDEVTRFKHQDVELQLQTAGFKSAVSYKETNKDNSTYYCTVALKSAFSPA